MPRWGAHAGYEAAPFCPAWKDTMTTVERALARPITPETGLIKAEGIVLSRGRRVGTAEGRVTDAKGILLALARPRA
jgi:hypothetical protein